MTANCAGADDPRMVPDRVRQRARQGQPQRHDRERGDHQREPDVERLGGHERTRLALAPGLVDGVAQAADRAAGRVDQCQHPDPTEGAGAGGDLVEQLLDVAARRALLERQDGDDRVHDRRPHAVVPEQGREGPHDKEQQGWKGQHEEEGDLSSVPRPSGLQHGVEAAAEHERGVRGATSHAPARCARAGYSRSWPAKNSSAVRVFVCCSPNRSTPRSARNARVSAATWNVSPGLHLVDSSRIREPSG